MKRSVYLIALVTLALAAAPAFSQQYARRAQSQGFASDLQTVPVMGNTAGVNGSTFQTYVAILNPTASSFPVTATLYDTTGTRHDATISLAAGELKTYTNFLDAVFHYTGGGAVVFQSPESAGGTHNNRFIVTAEIVAMPGRYSTTIPVLEFAGTNSRAFAGGISFDSNTRTNIGCFNQSDLTNSVKATVLDNSGQNVVGTIDLTLAPKAWAQAAVTSVVTNGYVRFDPAAEAVCYAVVVDNSTNDGRLTPATEYQP